MKVVNASLAVSLLELIKSDAELTVKFLEIDREYGLPFREIEMIRAKNFLKSIEMKIDALNSSSFSAKEIA